MALTACKDCGAPISQQARACPKCGAPPKRSAGLLGCCLVFAGLLLIGSFAGKGTPRASGARPYVYPSATPAQPATTQPDIAAPAETSSPPQVQQDYPARLVSVLASDAVFGGYACGLHVDQGWQWFDTTGEWFAILLRPFGENEVSCLLESPDASSVQHVELEAEFYVPGFMEAEMLMQFSQSAQVLMHPTMPPVEFARAVASKGEWSNADWTLTRVPYANGGFGLLLQRTGH